MNKIKVNNKKYLLALVALLAGILIFAGAAFAVNAINNVNEANNSNEQSKVFLNKTAEWVDVDRTKAQIELLGTGEGKGEDYHECCSV